MKDHKKADAAPKAEETPKEPIVDETVALIPETEPSGPSDGTGPTPPEETDLVPVPESDVVAEVESAPELPKPTAEEIAAAEAVHKTTMR